MTAVRCRPVPGLPRGRSALPKRLSIGHRDAEQHRAFDPEQALRRPRKLPLRNMGMLGEDSGVTAGTRGYPSRMILNAVIERDLQTGLLVGSVPGVPGAHTQGETVEEVRQNLLEVIALLRDEGALQPESEFIATTSLAVG